MSDNENLRTLLNLAPVDHPLHSCWRMFIFGLHGSALRNAAALLRELFVHPNRANLDTFTEYIIAIGFRVEGLLTTPRQNENNEEQEMVAHAAAASGVSGQNESEEVKKPDHVVPMSLKQSKNTEISIRASLLQKTNVSVKRRMVISSSDTEDERSLKRPVNWVSSADFTGTEEFMNKRKETTFSIRKNYSDEETSTDCVNSSSDSEHEVMQTPRLRIEDIYSSSDTDIRPSATHKGSRKKPKVNLLRKRNLNEVPNTPENETINLSEASKCVIVKGTLHHHIFRIGPIVSCGHGQELSTPIKTSDGKDNAQGAKGIKWICSKCNKDDFKTKFARDRHFRTCSGATPVKYVCPEVGCGATFDNSTDFRNHRNEHSANPKVFSCPYCSQGFLLQNERIRHVRKYHPKSFLKYFGEAKSESSSDD